MTRFAFRHTHNVKQARAGADTSGNLSLLAQYGFEIRLHDAVTSRLGGSAAHDLSIGRDWWKMRAPGKRAA